MLYIGIFVTQLEVLLESLRKELDEDAKLVFMYALTRLKDINIQACKEFSALLGNYPSAKVRKQAAVYLASASEEYVVAALCKALKEDRDDDVRSQAAISLKSSVAEKAFEPLLAAFKQDASEKVRRTAGEALLEINPEKAAPLILETTKGADSAAMKRLRILALNAVGGKNAIAEFFKMCEDRSLDSEIRAEALKRLQKLEKPEKLLETCARLLKEEVSRQIVEVALGGLIACGSEAQKYLREFAADTTKDVNLRRSTVESLSNSRDNFECLAWIIEKNNKDLSLLAAEKIATVNDERVVSLLERVLKAQDSDDAKKILSDALKTAKHLRILRETGQK